MNFVFNVTLPSILNSNSFLYKNCLSSSDAYLIFILLGIIDIRQLHNLPYYLSANMEAILGSHVT